MDELSSLQMVTVLLNTRSFKNLSYCGVIYIVTKFGEISDVSRKNFQEANSLADSICTSNIDSDRIFRLTPKVGFCSGISYLLLLMQSRSGGGWKNLQLVLLSFTSHGFRTHVLWQLSQFVRYFPPYLHSYLSAMMACACLPHP